MKKRLFLLPVIFLLAGCFGSRTPSVPLRHYMLEYAPPRVESTITADVVMKVERFTGLAEHLNRDMVYRPQPFVRDTYRYHRWNAAPVDMIHGLLLRDMRQTPFFRAVLSYEDAGVSRYIVEGQLTEFIEIEEKDRSLASLVIGITLTDTAKENTTAGVVFQKTYRMTEPLASPRHPASFAQGMSTAVARFSAALLDDLQKAVAARNK